MKKKPDAMPLEALLDAPGFERNCEILLSEPVAAPGATDSSRARKAITSLVISGAVERAKSKRQHVANSRKGGAASVQSRRSELALRNKTIAEDAQPEIIAPDDVARAEIEAWLAAHGSSGDRLDIDAWLATHGGNYAGFDFEAWLSTHKGESHVDVI